MAAKGWRLMLTICRFLAPPIARLIQRGNELMDLSQAAAEQSRQEREEKYLAIMRAAARQRD